MTGTMSASTTLVHTKIDWDSDELVTGPSMAGELLDMPSLSSDSAAGQPYPAYQTQGLKR